MNIMSLTYFIRRNQSRLSKRLMVFLNCLDLLVCLWSMVSVAVLILVTYEIVNYEIIKVFNGIRDTFAEATGFGTCLLSVSRTISLVVPFYEIQGYLIVVVTVLFILYLLVSKLFINWMFDASFTLAKTIDYLTAVEISLMIIVVTVCCLICSIKLISATPLLDKSTKSNSRNRYGTVTIVIISIIFSLVNLCYLLITLIWFRVVAFYGLARPVSFTFLITKEFTNIFCIPLNSTLNPIIYFTRKEEMRSYVRKCKLFRLCLFCWRSCFKRNDGVAQKDSLRRHITLNRKQTMISDL